MNTCVNRHKNIIDFALSSLLRRKVKNLSLLAVYTLIVFVLASLIFFVQAVRQEAAAILAEAPDIVVQRLAAGRHDLIPAGYAERIGAIRGVGRVAPRLWGYYFHPAFGATYTVMVPEEPIVAPGRILVGAGVARNQQIKVGDVTALRSSRGEPLPVTVGGVYPAASDLVAADLIVMSAADFHALFNLPQGYATDLAVTVANSREQATVAAKIAELFPDTRPILKSEILRTYDAIFEWRGGMMVVILATAVLSFVIFAWDKATGLSAEERKEIGILKSIGWETSDVLLLKFWEGAVISLTAFLVGIVLAYGHVFFFSAGLFESALKGWSVLYPRFRLVPVIDAFQVTVLFFLSVLPYTAATIVPAWLAASSDPDAAMRS
ncbi:ABC transporter permease [Geobacter sp. SVR]|uniref:ABC transporter permease n=1 Tax=Geobacter sp. SVR TaxID=2495594 RepID=UPI00143EF6F7|nr:FtsX-like permease family protein [Geobacter sp. SVR]BCS55330.1 ABC transporter permease [Geobacter sp. SVR]GCF87255.1 ABC transporter permease [Geobacter sp. SVR]